MFKSYILILLFIIFVSVCLLCQSGRLYNKLAWDIVPLCSNSVNKTLIFNNNNVSMKMTKRRKYIKLCSVACQLATEPCFAFQVNVTNSTSFNAFDVSCYQINDVPDSLYKNVEQNCFIYLATKPVYLNVISWGYLDTPNLPEYGCTPVDNRGVNVYRLNVHDHLPYDFQVFDVWKDQINAGKLVDYLKTTPNGTIVVGRTCDDPWTHIDPALPYLSSVNLDVSGLNQRGKWIFVWQQGAYKKTISFINNLYGPITKQFIIFNSGSYV
ncbi:hypothetical protein HELRODRAFT_172502 [Helobdella robusta]|uniref:ILEI/PANDER domain-containing protein n=1 Tax=Helobdella robusta TaxID=6412 RepID=T1F5F1_HELRO|nr:hypothetical protein HELRODRAFT_172502 [Helobdella robusta]ESO04160.1 hypothetical protein HELRODRAFT_172502 [Helobdella robusta]